MFRNVIKHNKIKQDKKCTYFMNLNDTNNYIFSNIGPTFIK